MSTRPLATLCLLCFASPLLHAQAKHTATRAGDLQIGAGFVIGASDYGPNLRGGALYVDFDRTSHWGGEFVVHQAYSSGDTHEYERTYEIGPRYIRHYGIASPYAKAMIGRGVFNYPGYYNSVTKTYGPSPANLAYNMASIGIGSDIRVMDHLNVRVDYEYQRWFGFPVNGLTPQLVTVGVAYHFRSDKIGFGRR